VVIVAGRGLDGFFAKQSCRDFGVTLR